MNIFICGDRKWNDLDTIKDALAPYVQNDPHIYYEVKPGASLVGKVAAYQLGLATHETSSLHGIDLVLAFHNYIRGSKDTMAWIEGAVNRKIPYVVINHDKDREK